MQPDFRDDTHVRAVEACEASLDSSFFGGGKIQRLNPNRSLDLGLIRMNHLVGLFAVRDGEPTNLPDALHPPSCSRSVDSEGGKLHGCLPVPASAFHV